MKRSVAGGTSIRVVAARTGIPADTLRVWERRYGFPKPARRAGGSRVFAEADVARLHVIAAALELGFRPGDVVSLPRTELEGLVARTRREARVDVAPPAARVTLEPVLDALRRDDVVTLRALLRSASVALGPRGFVTAFAQPLAVRVGDLWAEGDLDVRHEHLASASLTTQLRLLLGAFEDAEQAPVVLLTTLPGESHSLGLDMVAVYLAACAASPRLLGPDTPPPQIAKAAAALGADAVGLHVSPVADLDRAAEGTRELLALLPARVELWLGGGGVERLDVQDARIRRATTWSALDGAVSSLRSSRAA